LYNQAFDSLKDKKCIDSCEIGPNQSPKPGFSGFLKSLDSGRVNQDKKEDHKFSAKKIIFRIFGVLVGLSEKLTKNKFFNRKYFFNFSFALQQAK